MDIFGAAVLIRDANDFQVLCFVSANQKVQNINTKPRSSAQMVSTKYQPYFWAVGTVYF